MLPSTICFQIVMSQKNIDLKNILGKTEEKVQLNQIIFKYQQISDRIFIYVLIDLVIKIIHNFFCPTVKKFLLLS
jgi:hypothetical protein